MTRDNAILAGTMQRINKAMAFGAVLLFLSSTLAMPASADLITGTATNIGSTVDFFPASQLSDGSASLQWVTDNRNGGSPADYFVPNPASPTLRLDLGSDTTFDAFSVWNYNIVGNSTKTMSLRFATEADGGSGFGTSIAYNPTLSPSAGQTVPVRQDIALSQNVTARYVELTISDNWNEAGAGGDRVGMAELQVNQVEQLTGNDLRTATVTNNGLTADFFPTSQASDGNTATNWVTTNRNGSGDYFGTGQPNPVLLFDLGENVMMEGFGFWNYDIAGNRTTRMSMRFATAADGAGGLGTSISYNPTFNPLAIDQSRQDFLFDQWLTVRYMELTLLDNYWGFGTGGDRVGFAELQFSAVPEPAGIATASMAGLLLLGCLWRRRRTANRLSVE